VKGVIVLAAANYFIMDGWFNWGILVLFPVERMVVVMVMD
jgi:hypothetical protein